MNEITYLTEETYETVLSGAEAAVVDYYADWCGPCKAMLP
ncbi:MAG: thiol reductase thioredoxin, partial [Firmicutes bacterium]|nr:thiol reductase thioredoxin [Bacillota bacterium]